MKVFVVLAAFSLAAGDLPAQVTLADVGYRIPTKLITAAPNQIVVLSFENVPRKPPGSVNTFPGPTGYPVAVNGLSVKVTDGSPTPLDAGMIAFQQNERLTSLTVLIPSKLAVPAYPFFDFTGTLTLFDNGVPLAQLPFRPVSDKPHFLNSCDESRISVGVLQGVSNVSDCFPVVLNHGRLVTAENPLRIGDGISSYLYGLGAIVLRDDPFGRPEIVQSFDLNFDYRPNAPAVRAAPGFGITGKPFFSAGYAGGLYQVNFMIPDPGFEPPACNGTTIRSNLTVTISGPNSQDSASFCVHPHP